ncbi:MAG TPA: aminotransferase class I/II-fold pyridoxal phosphate-dependent enzyme [Polyangiaceae bacterium]|nr:aminotransferase class I/II-fold pyridoxal phosphate-dependent enzyme [Polyangiaceae bacterium]
MDAGQASRFSLADFFGPETEDPLEPPSDYAEWRNASTWATGLYERRMLAAPTPRTEIDAGGSRHSVVNLASYNYLGLATHPETVAAAKAALDHYGTGACGSPVLSGKTDLHGALESALVDFTGREAALLFNSGFGGALGTLQGLLRKGDVAVIDDKSHMCLIDGTKLAGAQVLPFAHNDPESLDEALTRTKGKRRLVVVEGVYSMDGDVADLPALLEVTERHGVGVMIDEAHSILAMGKTGGGVTEHFGAESRIALKYATFSKAFASCGSFVAGRSRTLEYLRYYANPYGFSCALPPPVVASVLKALEIARRDDSLRSRLAENATYFRTQLHALGIDTGTSTTHVVPIILGPHRELLYMLSYAMLARGLFVAPVDYPSVPEDQVRFRASITAAHTRADLDEALNIIEGTVVKALRNARQVRAAS